MATQRQPFLGSGQGVETELAEITLAEDQNPPAVPSPDGSRRAAEVVLAKARRALRQTPSARPSRSEPAATEESADHSIIRGLREYERDFIEVCARDLRNSRGCFTPYEEFFSSLVLYSRDGGVTPETVEFLLSQFRANWNEVLRVAARFLRDYPEEVAAELVRLAEDDQ